MRKLLFALVLMCAGTALAAQTVATKTKTSSDAEHPARRITVLGVSNFGEVNSHLYRGGQPKGAGYANLKKMGVDVVVDLRLSGKDTEKKNVTKAGMEYVAISWHCMFPKDKHMARFLGVLEENKGKKIFVHCRYGDDRTGMMIAAYRMAVEGWTPEKAKKEMEKFGFHHLVCPRLGPYERDFPDHLKKSSAFKEWREQRPVLSR